MSDFFSKFICIYHKKAEPLQLETINVSPIEHF